MVTANFILPTKVFMDVPWMFFLSRCRIGIVYPRKGVTIYIYSNLTRNESCLNFKVLINDKTVTILVSES
jgi:hypothetical protein